MNKTIVFDLDDTLYSEKEYLMSGFSYISHKIGKTKKTKEEKIKKLLTESYLSELNPFEELIKKFSLKYSVDYLKKLYREHSPQISLSNSSKRLLDQLLIENYNLGLLTDGRSIQQRNKIKSLKLDKYFKFIIISEEFGSLKPSKKNYLFFSEIAFPKSNTLFYVGDNIKKDFITPNKLGWITICKKDDGNNIHDQNFSVEEKYLPKYVVDDLYDIYDLIKEL